MTGILFGLGIGPGDPELITLKALRILQAVDVVAYPAPEKGESLARTIAGNHIRGGQAEEPLRMPFEVDPGPARAAYDRAADTLAGHLEAGRDVAVLCEGDPFFYGSFMYLFARLAPRFIIEVVPGVSSLTAAAAAAGLPLVSRNEVLTVIPAPLAAEALAERLRTTDAAAIVKLGRHFSRVREVLLALGRAEKARYVERASTGHERSLALSEVDPASVPYFSMILVPAAGEGGA